MTAGAPLADGLHEVGPGKLACVVTSLEMLERPTVRPVLQRDDLALRHTPDPRLDWYRDLFRRVGAHWLWSSRLLLDDTALRAMLRDADVEDHALEHAGVDEGLLELDFRVAGVCEIAFLGVTPTMIGRGAGRWLMDRAIALAWSRPITRLWLHTCTLDHPDALAFYRRSGFTAYKNAVEVMDDPRRTGLFAADTAPQVPSI